MLFSIFIVVLLTVTGYFLFKTKRKPVPPAVKYEFGLMVTNFGKDMYCIMFSKNGFLTKQALLTVVDISFFGEPERVYANTYLFEDYNEAVEYAQQFTSYELCEEHNQKVKNEVQALLAYYKENLPENRYPSKPANPRIETIIFKQPLL